MLRMQLAVLSALAAVSGCGDALYPVEGRLEWPDGKPAVELAGSQVMFESEVHHSISRSVVGADASFRLTTDQPEDGVPPGLHQVYIVESRGPMGEGDRASKARIDKRFARPETSGLELTVGPGMGPVVFKVEPPPKR